MFTIILFYKYVHIENPEEQRKSQRALAEKYNLLGRIIIAHEGINVTLEGTNEHIESYLREFLADSHFNGTHIKKSCGTGDSFPRLSVKIRPEIVTLGVPNFNSLNHTGKILSPEDLKEWYKNKKVGQDFYVVDLRNDYEYNVGRFKGSIMPRLENFRDVPRVLSELDDLKDKPVVTVCTGDVRCEKASAYLASKGFTDVYHLYGGIVTYMEKFPASEFEGSLYVFDKRKVMHFDNPDKHVVVGKCMLCQCPCENYVNCAYPQCNKHFICCEECSGTKPLCSDECKEKMLVAN